MATRGECFASLLALASGERGEKLQSLFYAFNHSSEGDGAMGKDDLLRLLQSVLPKFGNVKDSHSPAQRYSSAQIMGLKRA